MKKDFQNEPLSTMVAIGAVGANSARLWFRANQSGKYLIHCKNSRDENQSFELTTDIPENNLADYTCSVALPEKLSPLTRYTFSIKSAADEKLVGDGSFETAPANADETPERFSIAVMSCNQPFDESGNIRKEAGQMLKATRQCLEQHNTKMVFLAGDQVYSDYPPGMSLFEDNYFRQVAPENRQNILECNSEEVRQLLHRRYRHFWAMPEWQAIQANWPCYPILDDHDIIDNWGSDPVHQSETWLAFGEGARSAYLDYQGSRISLSGTLPKSFHYSVEYGNTATFVMDLRSERIAGDNGRLFSDQQEEDVRKFLTNNATQKVLFIVLSVPVIHLPKFLTKTIARITASGEDFSDRWSSGSHTRDRDNFLKLLRNHQKNHPHQRLIILSGDIHIGCVHKIDWIDHGKEFYQLISSPITHHTGQFIATASNFLIRSNREVATGDEALYAKVKLLPGVEGYKKNPYGKLNIGLVQVETKSASEQPELRFMLYGHDGDRPVCVYKSEPIR